MVVVRCIQLSRGQNNGSVHISLHISHFVDPWSSVVETAFVRRYLSPFMGETACVALASRFVQAQASLEYAADLAGHADEHLVNSRDQNESFYFLLSHVLLGQDRPSCTRSHAGAEE